MSKVSSKMLCIKRHLLLICITLSTLLHLGSYVQISHLERLFTGKKETYKPQKTNKPIKITFHSPTPKKKPVETELNRKILEVKQEENEAPKKYRFLGQVNRSVKEETKIAQSKIKVGKAMKAGSAKKQNKLAQSPQAKPPKQEKAAPKPKQEGKAAVAKKEAKKKASKQAKVAQQTKDKPKIKSTHKHGLKISSYTPPPAPAKARNAYEQFLNKGFAQMGGQIEAGYQDHLKEDLKESDRIDINTRQYRYIGYFTGLRRSIEMVWTYPKMAANRGLQGSVGLEFSIAKSGRATKIKVIKSSGYSILDNAIVKAVREASPFAPLPDGFKKKALLVSGNFNYVLGYGMAH